MTDEVAFEPRRSGSFLSWLGWLWVGLVVIYPLSTGPVVHLCLTVDGPYSVNSAAWKTVEMFYAPLIYLIEEFEPVSDFFEWYLDLWGLF